MTLPSPLSSEQSYGVLLISFSRHSHQRSFVPLYLAHPRTHIVAVADEGKDIPDDLRALNRAWARKLDVPYVEAVDDALGLEGVNIVSIGHEIERRADLITRAARAGKHIWIDKFLGASMDECDDVVEAVEEAGTVAIVPSYTYGELVERSRRLIDSGQLGQLLGVHVDVMFSKGWPRPPGASQQRPFLPPGRWKFPDIKRELLTVGAYAVGLIQSCCAPVAQVYGHAGAFFFPEHAAHGAEDFGTLTMVDEEGRLASLCGGRIGVATHPMGGPSRAWIVGTAGSAAVDAKRPAIDVHIRRDIADADYTPPADDPMQWASGPPNLSIPVHGDSGLARGLDDLIASIDEGRDPLFTVRDARTNMQVLLAGYHSVVEGRPVDLPLARSR